MSNSKSRLKSESKLESYFNKGDILNFYNELKIFIKYILKKNYSGIIIYDSDFFNDVFLFIYEKLKSEDYKYNEKKGNFDSYIYTLARWFITKYVYRSKKRSEIYRKIEDENNIYRSCCFDDFYGRNLKDRILYIIDKLKIKNKDEIINLIFYGCKINNLRLFNKICLITIKWVLHNEEDLCL